MIIRFKGADAGLFLYILWFTINDSYIYEQLWLVDYDINGAGLHLSDELGELSQWLMSWWQHLKHCPCIIIFF